MQNLNKTFVTTNILYDRMFPLANVDEYTGLPAASNMDTTHPDHLMQAYYEIYNSAYNNNGRISPDALDELIKTNGNSREHPIGIFYYKFNSLDTNALQDHLIDTLANGQFVDVANRPRSPYFTNTSFLAAPLLADGQVMETGNQTFYFDPAFFLHNDSLTITQVRIDFGDGQGEWVVNNPYNAGGQLARPFLSSILKNIGGTLFGRITVIGVDILGRIITMGNPFKVFVKNTKIYRPLTDCRGGKFSAGTRWVIEAPQSRLDPINAQYGNPQLEYKNKDGNPVKDTAYFYFSGDGTVCNPAQLKRPILFIDGFDPDNSRTVQKIYEDYINTGIIRSGYVNPLFGDYMLNEGYDFVILDFKHGNDLLERNAMTLVSLIERLNQQYGSTMLQGITLIGPSMGSLIAQYALAYMEKNNIPHNVKTYISFDGCHQGANVPIGLQNYVEYFTKRGIFKKNKSIREGLYNGLGAKQMLAHHVSANSQSPVPDALRTTFLQNLAAVNEYPQLCRKVALLNGTNTGQINSFHPNPSETLLRISTQRKGWKSLWGLCSDKICMKLDWSCYTTPNSGTAKVMDNWTVAPLFNLLFWVPLGKTNSYANAAWGNSAQDNAPGGTFGTLFGNAPGNINESNFGFLLKEAMYLLTGSKRTSFSQNLNQFTMMPSYSAADLRFPNKNLYMKWDDQYLCGKTPFDYVYAPPTNEEHVLVSANGAQYFENEVRCNITSLPTYINPVMVGNSVLCTTGDYSIVTCKPGINVVWTATPLGLVNIAGTGSAVTLNKAGNGTVTLTATISNCNNTYIQTVSKTIQVGTPQPGYINFIQDICAEFPVSTNYFPNTTYTWSFFKMPYSYNLQSFPNSGSSKKLNLTQGSGNYRIGVTADNSCGSSNIIYITVPVTCSGGHFAIAPNPTTSADVTVSVKVQKATTTNKMEAPIQIDTKIYEIRVLDKLGVVKKVVKFPNGTNSTQISLSGLKPDLYVVHIFDGITWSTEELLVK